MKKMLFCNILTFTMCICYLSNIVFAGSPIDGMSDDVYYIAKAEAILSHDTVITNLVNAVNEGNKDKYYMTAQYINDEKRNDPLLDASINTYNALTWAPPELQSTPSYYDEILILDILTKDILDSEESINANYDSIYSDVESTFKMEWKLLKSTDLVPTKEDIAALTDAEEQEFFEKILKKYNRVSVSLEAISNIVDGAGTILDMYDRVAKFVIISERNDKTNEILLSMANKSNDYYMESALKSVAAIYGNSDADITKYIADIGTVTAYNLIVNYAFDCIDASLRSGPLAALFVARDVSKFVSDKLFSTSDLVSYYKNAERISIFEDLVVKEATSIVNKYNNESSSSFTDYADKSEKVCLVRELYYKTLMYDIDFGKKVNNALERGYISVFKGSTIEEYNSMADESKNLFSASYRGINNDLIGSTLRDKTLVFDNLTLKEGDNIGTYNLKVNGNLTIASGDFNFVGDVSVLGNLVVVDGDVCFNGNTNVTGDVSLQKGSITINSIMNVDGDFEHVSNLRFKTTTIAEGGKLTVRGGFLHKNIVYPESSGVSDLYVNGSLIINTFYDAESSGTKLYMTNDSSYMEVGTDFKYYPENMEDNFTKGTIVINGNYYNNSITKGTIIKFTGMHNTSTRKTYAKDCFSGIITNVKGTSPYVYINKDNKLIVPESTIVTIEPNANTYQNAYVSYVYLYNFENNGELNISGNLCVDKNTNLNFKGDTKVTGDILLENGNITISGVMNVDGVFEHDYNLYSKTTTIAEGGKLSVKSGFIHNNGLDNEGVCGISDLYINGSLIIDTYYRTNGHHSRLYMTKDTSYMEVGTNFTIQYEDMENNFIKGTIVINGSYYNDIITKGTIIKFTSMNNGDSRKITAKDCFKGNITNVTGTTPYVYINKDNKLIVPEGTTVTIKPNPSDDPDVIKDRVYLYNCENNGVMEILGKLYVEGGGNLNFNGSTEVRDDVLLVHGNITISGVMNVGEAFEYSCSSPTKTTTIAEGGKLTVKGWFEHFNDPDSDVCGVSDLFVNGSLIIGSSYDTTSYGAKLYMTNDNSYMEVGKDFKYYCENMEDNFTKGTIVVKGGYTNKSKLNGTMLKLLNGQSIGKSCPLGDANMDGRVDRTDSLDALKHITRIKTINDDVALALANINNDNSVNMIDVIEILKKAY